MKLQLPFVCFSEVDTEFEISVRCTSWSLEGQVSGPALGGCGVPSSVRDPARQPQTEFQCTLVSFALLLMTWFWGVRQQPGYQWPAREFRAGQLCFL